MDNELRELLTDTDEIHLQLHCTIESVRQCWIALTQGDNEPCEDDYDALFGVYRRLSQLDHESSLLCPLHHAADERGHGAYLPRLRRGVPSAEEE